MGQCSSLREEFRCKNFWFNHKDPSRFVVSQVGPRLVYPIWTGVWLLYHIVWFCLDVYHASTGGIGYNLYLIYLTNWGYLALGIFNLTDFAVTLYFHIHHADHLEDKIRTDTDQSDMMPWYMKVLWCLFEIYNTIAILISIAFLGLLTFDRSPESIEKHLISTIYIVLNLFVSAKPVRLFHFIYPLLFAAVYVLFSVIYQVGGKGGAIYDILNWDYAENTIIYVVILVLVGVPIVHLVVFALYLLRMLIYKQVCRKNISIDDKPYKNGSSNSTTHF